MSLFFHSFTLIKIQISLCYCIKTFIFICSHHMININRANNNLYICNLNISFSSRSPIRNEHLKVETLLKLKEDILLRYTLLNEMKMKESHAHLKRCQNL